MSVSQQPDCFEVMERLDRLARNAELEYGRCGPIPYDWRRRMNAADYKKKVQELFRQHEDLIARKNVKARSGKGCTTATSTPF